MAMPEWAVQSRRVVVDVIASVEENITELARFVAFKKHATEFLQRHVITLCGEYIDADCRWF
jgi:hypothetical protein